jgi:DNA-binding NarL/FixJ family response regulator
VLFIASSGISPIGPLFAGKILRQGTDKQEESTTRPPKTDQHEVVVIELVVHGVSNPEIVDPIHTLEGTVRNHINYILTRLEVADQLLKRCYTRQVIDILE